MKSLVYWTAPLVLAFASCASGSRHAAALGSMAGRFSVDPEFAGGASVLAAAKRASPTSDLISLSDPVIGSDAQYDYVMFFVGRDTRTGFEGIYYRHWVFAKLKAGRDWSVARVFDWPGRYAEPFAGPIERLEKEGRELPEKNTFRFEVRQK